MASSRGLGIGVALAAAACVVLALWWQRAEPGSDGPALGRGAALEPLRDDVAALSGTEGIGAGAREPSRTPEPVATTSAPVVGDVDPEAEGDASLSAPPVEGVLVRVFRGREKTPVAGALVTYGVPAPVPAARRGLAARAMDEDLEQVARYRTDDEGRVRVPFGDRVAVAIAAHGADWGSAHIPAGRQVAQQEIVLEPDRTAQVRVVHESDGSPAAGVEVELRYHYDEESSEIVDREVTDDDGVVRFEHLRQHLEWFWGHIEFFTIGLAGLLEPPVEARVDLDALFQEHELVCPPTGVLEVEVLGPDGRRFDGPAQVHAALGVGGFDGEPVDEAVAGTEDGRVRFERIGLSEPLAVFASSSLYGNGEPVRLRSAAQPGSVLSAQVSLPPKGATLVARVLLPDGSPAGGETVGVRHERLRRRARTVNAELDGDGVGVWAIRDIAGFPEPVPVEFRLVLDGRSVTCRLDFQPPVQGEALELGDVRLEHAAVLARGTVVDPSGAPVEGARVWPSGRQSFGNVSRETSDADGAFEIRGTPPSGEYRLAAHHADYRYSTSGPVHGVAMDVQIVMEAAGSIVGSALLDPVWLHEFTVVRARSAGSEYWNHSDYLDRQGGFRLGSLASGAYTVQLALESDGESAMTFEDVLVEAGEVTRDPRLQDVDLRGLARYFEVSVRDGLGDPVEEGWIYLREAGTSEWSDDDTFIEFGVAHVFTLADPVEAYVYGEGLRAVHLPELRPGDEVVLEAPRRFALCWPGAAPRFREGVRLSTRCEVDDPGMPRLPVFGSVNAADSEPRWCVFPGERNLSVTLSLRLDKGAPDLQLPESEKLRFRLDPAEADQRFELELPEAFVPFLAED